MVGGLFFGQVEKCNLFIIIIDLEFRIYYYIYFLNYLMIGMKVNLNMGNIKELAYIIGQQV
jgi:hypothetical protein